MDNPGLMSTTAASAGHQRDMLEAAAKFVDNHMQADNCFPQLIDLFKAAGDIPSVSGLSDHDYPVLTDVGGSLRSLAQLNAVKKIPLPAELVEQFGHMQSNCQMGLFPEIGRAWLTIDSDIFAWTYEDGGDLAYFDGLSETILSVGLVKPKPGIFQKHIKYLLCLTTPVEIVLLGVSFTCHSDDSPTAYEEMHLLPEPLFSLPTDNTYMLVVTGMDNGRIFLGAKDGSIYELAYQAEDGWFSRRCRLINHSSSTLSFLVPSFLNFAFSEDDPVIQIAVDNTRNILYGRTEKGSLEVFDLGMDGKQMTRVTSLSHNAIVQQAASAAKNIDRSNFRPVVHISPIEIQESLHVHLVAVTQTGVRLYFTTTSVNFPESRPFSLTLLHVRLPPGFSANAPPQRPTHVHTTHFKRGHLLMASSRTDENDVLWAMSSDAFPFQMQLMEMHTTTFLDGRVWAMSEVPLPQPPKPFCTLVVKNAVVPIEPPLVVSQHMEYARKYILLSAQGSHMITKPRPVDQLRQLLLDHNGADNEAVKAFFLLHKETQACAMCLILACTAYAQDKRVVEWATRAFLIYGGEPRLSFPPTSGHSAFPAVTSPQAPPSSLPQPIMSSTPVGHQNPYLGAQVHSPPASPFQVSPMYSPTSVSAAQSPSFFPHMPMAQGQQPQHQDMMVVPPGGGAANIMSGPNMTYSGKHDGLYLYFSRILRPIWNFPVVSELPLGSSEGGQKEFVTSSASSEELSRYLEQLTCLKNFVHENLQFSSFHTSEGALLHHRQQNLPAVAVLNLLQPNGFSPGDTQQQIQHKSQVEAHRQERISLLNLERLLSLTCEVIGLWKVLCDHQFHAVYSLLNEDLQNQLRSMTCRDFIISGKDVAGSLVSALISRFLDDNATTDAISNRLREVCPSIYRTEDAVFSKAHEMITNARNAQNRAEKERLLKEALHLCKQISPQLNPSTVSSLFLPVHSYDGLAELCLSAAQRRDPQNLAVHYYRNGEPPEDQQGLQAYVARMEWYKALLDMMGHLMALSASHPQSPSIPKVPGPPSPTDPNMLSPEEAKRFCEHVFQMALKSDDELFHNALYGWLIEHQMTEKLLEMRTPYIEKYLKRCTTLYPESLANMDLMWKYYEKNHNYSSAARILSKLADKHGTELNLRQRLDYLARAIMCVKSSELRTSGTTEGEFLHELEEKLEVARIQLQVMDALQQRCSQHPQQRYKDAIDTLNSDLLDITQLYKDFAEPFDLPECKLAIIHCAGHYDPTLVETLWKNIVDKELRESADCPPETQMARLSTKLKSLGKLYIHSQNYLPLTFLIKHLELRTCSLGFDLHWLYKTLLAVGVGLPHLFDLYHKLYKAKDSCWHRKPLHLLNVIHAIVQNFVDVPTLVPQGERRQFITKCLDCISSYLVDLQTRGDGFSQQLLSQYKGLQIRLERMAV